MVDDGYAAIVDGWLDADVRMSVKQRHIATRVYERLVAECGYSSVQRWIKRWRQEHRTQSSGFADLEWAPGSAQVDFGQARAVVAGLERVVHFLAVSFPYSNMRWVVALPGETSECVCQGLLEVFERTGMTGAVVFDNATGVGHRNADGMGHPDPPVLPALRALRVRAPVLQPVCVCQIEAVQNGVSIQSEKAASFSPVGRKDPPPLLFGFYPIRAWVRLYDSPSNLIILP